MAFVERTPLIQGKVTLKGCKETTFLPQKGRAYENDREILLYELWNKSWSSICFAINLILVFLIIIVYAAESGNEEIRCWQRYENEGENI